jgi:tetratricopeptide (TPR) repeat protein
MRAAPSAERVRITNGLPPAERLHSLVDLVIVVMRSFLKLAMLFLWTMPALGMLQPGDSSQFDSLLIAARQAQARSDYAAAANYYRQAVKINSGVAELWANLGLMEHETGDYVQAIQSFQRAARLQPSLYVPNLFLGIDYVHIGKAEEAVPFLLKAEKINAADPQAPLALGRAYSSLRSFPAAIRAYSRAITLNPQDGSAWFAFGISILDQVEADGRKISADGQNSSYAKALLAESLAEQSRFKEAAEQYKTAIAANPQPPCMRSELGFVYLQQHEDAAGEPQFTADLQEGRTCALAALGQARLRIDAGEDEAALKLLKMLWIRDPGWVRSNASALANGLSTEQSSRVAEYVNQQHDAGKIEADLYESLLAVMRGTPQRFSPLNLSGNASTNGAPIRTQASSAADHDAEAKYQLGRYETCANGLMSSQATENTDQLLLLATCAWMTGDYQLSARAGSELEARLPQSLAARYWSIKANEKLALSAFSHFEQLEPDSERTHLLLGDMYRQRQRFEQAEEEYKRASALAPADPAPLFGLASAYSVDSKMDEALTTAKAALVMSPDDPDLNLLTGEILVIRREWAQAETVLKKSLGAKPQMLPHVHVLLGEAYQGMGRTHEAITQLQMGLASDEDGSVYYRLARIYSTMGKKAAADDAIEHVRALQKKRREGAVIAVQDSGATQSDIQ